MPLMARCRKPIWRSTSVPWETEGTDIPRGCGRRFGLEHLDHNRGAGRCGHRADGAGRRPAQTLHPPFEQAYPLAYRRLATIARPAGPCAVVALCAIRPLRGGENALLDHEIAYLLMRDANPEYVRADAEDDVDS